MSSKQGHNDHKLNEKCGICDHPYYSHRAPGDPRYEDSACEDCDDYGDSCEGFGHRPESWDRDLDWKEWEDVVSGGAPAPDEPRGKHDPRGASTADSTWAPCPECNSAESFAVNGQLICAGCERLIRSLKVDEMVHGYGDPRIPRSGANKRDRRTDSPGFKGEEPWDYDSRDSDHWLLPYTNKYKRDLDQGEREEYLQHMVEWHDGQSALSDPRHDVWTFSPDDGSQDYLMKKFFEIHKMGPHGRYVHHEKGKFSGTNMQEFLDQSDESGGDTGGPRDMVGQEAYQNWRRRHHEHERKDINREIYPHVVDVGENDAGVPVHQVDNKLAHEGIFDDPRFTMDYQGDLDSIDHHLTNIHGIDWNHPARDEYNPRSVNDLGTLHDRLHKNKGPGLLACPQHGGTLGGDETCDYCTDEDGHRKRSATSRGDCGWEELYHDPRGKGFMGKELAKRQVAHMSREHGVDENHPMWLDWFNAGYRPAGNDLEVLHAGVWLVERGYEHEPWSKHPVPEALQALRRGHKEGPPPSMEPEGEWVHNPDNDPRKGKGYTEAPVPKMGPELVQEESAKLMQHMTDSHPEYVKHYGDIPELSEVFDEHKRWHNDATTKGVGDPREPMHRRRVDHEHGEESWDAIRDWDHEHHFIVHMNPIDVPGFLSHESDPSEAIDEALDWHESKGHKGLFLDRDELDKMDPEERAQQEDWGEIQYGGNTGIPYAGDDVYVRELKPEEKRKYGAQYSTLEAPICERCEGNGTVEERGITRGCRACEGTGTLSHPFSTHGIFGSDFWGNREFGDPRVPRNHDWQPKKMCGACGYDEDYEYMHPKTSGPGTTKKASRAHYPVLSKFDNYQQLVDHVRTEHELVGDRGNLEGYLSESRYLSMWHDMAHQGYDPRTSTRPGEIPFGMKRQHRHGSVTAAFGDLGDPRYEGFRCPFCDEWINAKDGHGQQDHDPDCMVNIQPESSIKVAGWSWIDEFKADNRWEQEHNVCAICGEDMGTETEVCPFCLNNASGDSYENLPDHLAQAQSPEYATNMEGDPRTGHNWKCPCGHLDIDHGPSFCSECEYCAGWDFETHTQIPRKEGPRRAHKTGATQWANDPRYNTRDICFECDAPARYRLTLNHPIYGHSNVYCYGHAQEIINNWDADPEVDPGSYKWESLRVAAVRPGFPRDPYDPRGTAYTICNNCGSGIWQASSTGEWWHDFYASDGHSPLEHDDARCRYLQSSPFCAGRSVGLRGEPNPDVKMTYKKSSVRTEFDPRGQRCFHCGKPIKKIGDPGTWGANTYGYWTHMDGNDWCQREKETTALPEMHELTSSEKVGPLVLDPRAGGPCEQCGCDASSHLLKYVQHRDPVTGGFPEGARYVGCGECDQCLEYIFKSSSVDSSAPLSARESSDVPRNSPGTEGPLPLPGAHLAAKQWSDMSLEEKRDHLTSEPHDWIPGKEMFVDPPLRTEESVSKYFDSLHSEDHGILRPGEDFPSSMDPRVPRDAEDDWPVTHLPNHHLARDWNDPRGYTCVHCGEPIATVDSPSPNPIPTTWHHTNRDTPVGSAYCNRPGVAFRDLPRAAPKEGSKTEPSPLRHKNDPRGDIGLVGAICRNCKLPIYKSTPEAIVPNTWFHEGTQNAFCSNTSRPHKTKPLTLDGSKTAQFGWYDPVRDVSTTNKTPGGPIPTGDAGKGKMDPWYDEADNGQAPPRPGMIFDPKLKKWIQDGQAAIPGGQGWFGPGSPVTDKNKLGHAGDELEAIECPTCSGLKFGGACGECSDRNSLDPCDGEIDHEPLLDDKELADLPGYAPCPRCNVCKGSGRCSTCKGFGEIYYDPNWGKTFHQNRDPHDPRGRTTGPGPRTAAVELPPFTSMVEDEQYAHMMEHHGYDQAHFSYGGLNFSEDHADDHSGAVSLFDDYVPHTHTADPRWPLTDREASRDESDPRGWGDWDSLSRDEKIQHLKDNHRSAVDMDMRPDFLWDSQSFNPDIFHTLDHMPHSKYQHGHSNMTRVLSSAEAKPFMAMTDEEKTDHLLHQHAHWLSNRNLVEPELLDGRSHAFDHHSNVTGMFPHSHADDPRYPRFAQSGGGQVPGDHRGDNGIVGPIEESRQEALDKARKVIPGTQQGFPGTNKNNISIDNQNKIGATEESASDLPSSVRTVHVVSYDPNLGTSEGDPRYPAESDTGIGGFDWFYKEDDAKEHYQNSVREWPGSMVRRHKLDVPKDLDGDGITDWIDSEYGILDEEPPEEATRLDKGYLKPKTGALAKCKRCGGSGWWRAERGDPRTTIENGFRDTHIECSRCGVTGYEPHAFVPDIDAPSWCRHCGFHGTNNPVHKVSRVSQSKDVDICPRCEGVGYLDTEAFDPRSVEKSEWGLRVCKDCYSTGLVRHSFEPGSGDFCDVFGCIAERDHPIHNLNKTAADDDSYLGDEYIYLCPACGDPGDYCRGHGQIGDPSGWHTLQLHDSGIHTDCVQGACEEKHSDEGHGSWCPKCKGYGAIDLEGDPRYPKWDTNNMLEVPEVPVGDCPKCKGTGKSNDPRFEFQKDAASNDLLLHLVNNHGLPIESVDVENLPPDAELQEFHLTEHAEGMNDHNPEVLRVATVTAAYGLPLPTKTEVNRLRKEFEKDPTSASEFPPGGYTGHSGRTLKSDKALAEAAQLHGLSSDDVALWAGSTDARHFTDNIPQDHDEMVSGFRKSFDDTMPAIWMERDHQQGKHNFTNDPRYDRTKCWYCRRDNHQRNLEIQHDNGFHGEDDFSDKDKWEKFSGPMGGCSGCHERWRAFHKANPDYAQKKREERERRYRSLKSGSYDDELGVEYRSVDDPRGPAPEGLEPEDVEQMRTMADDPQNYKKCPDCRGTRYVNHGMDGCGLCGGLGFVEREDRNG